MSLISGKPTSIDFMSSRTQFGFYCCKIPLLLASTGSISGGCPCLIFSLQRCCFSVFLLRIFSFSNFCNSFLFLVIARFLRILSLAFAFLSASAFINCVVFSLCFLFRTAERDCDNSLDSFRFFCFHFCCLSRHFASLIC